MIYCAAFVCHKLEKKKKKLVKTISIIFCHATIFKYRSEYRNLRHIIIWIPLTMLIVIAVLNLLLRLLCVPTFSSLMYIDLYLKKKTSQSWYIITIHLNKSKLILAFGSPSRKKCRHSEKILVSPCGHVTFLFVF